MYNFFTLIPFTYSLYQEVPCSDGELQTVMLRPGRTWRFQSPNFPSIRGYPDSLECTWRFRADHKLIGDVEITCDHFDVDGNFFQSCKLFGLFFNLSNAMNKYHHFYKVSLEIRSRVEIRKAFCNSLRGCFLVCTEDQRINLCKGF